MSSTIDLSFMDGVRYAESGYNVAQDVATHTIDGVDLNDLWSEFQETVNLVNAERVAISSLFTFGTTKAFDYIVQGSTAVEFEEASEFGEPTSGRVTPPTPDPLGYPMKWYDAAKRYTWEFIREAQAGDLQALHNQFLEGDNRLVYKHTMNALFGNTNRAANKEGFTVYSLWNGTDGKTPPSFAGQTFESSHSHYMVSGGATITATNLEDLITNVTEHGYGLDGGETLVILANTVEAKVISGFRAGTNGASYDFIPSDAAPAYLTDEILVGERPPSRFNGLKVIGSYGGALIVEDYHVPAGYVVAVATGGPNSPRNPLAFREHVRAEYRGLRLISGDNTRYPLIDSFYSRGFGVGVRHRGAAAVMQVKASGSYTAPSLIF